MKILHIDHPNKNLRCHEFDKLLCLKVIILFQFRIYDVINLKKKIDVTRVGALDPINIIYFVFYKLSMVVYNRFTY
jgi:hypothetical protein